MTTIGSLFTGYGGLDMAAEQFLDAETVWCSDIDPGACKVIAHRMPGVPNLGDITTIDWATVEPVDVITAGFPCQDLSLAGARRGVRPGTRSGLWEHVAYAVSVLRPRLLIIENVRGLLSAAAHSDVEPCPWCVGGAEQREPDLRALGAVLGSLAELGYDARWCGLRAADVGAPHGRFRIFLAAHPAGSGLDGWARVEVGGPVGGVAAAGGGEDARLLPTPRTSDTNGGGQHGDGGLDLRTAVSLLPTPTASDRNQGGTTQGNRKSPNLSIAALLPTPLASDAGPRGGTTGYELRDTARELMPTPRATRGGSGSETMQRLGAVRDDTARPQGELLLPTPTTEPTTGNGHARDLGAESCNWGQYADAIARWEAITRPAPPPTEPTSRGGHRLSPRLPEWMQGLPDGWLCDVPGITRNEALKAAGNGVCPQQAYAALEWLLGRELAVAA